MPEVELPQGTVRYTDTGGEGPVVVLVHGAFVSGSLWRDVVGPLSEHARVVVPELPLGSHEVPLRADADLTPPGVARLIADFLAALDLRGVTLVGNDTGGAMCQLVATRHGERLARLVLTNCDAYENFLPPAFRYLQVMARIPGSMWLLAQAVRSRAIRQAPLAFGWLSVREVDAERAEAWVRPLRLDAGIRRDLVKVLRGISTRYTLRAAEQLREFDRPVLLAWGRRDRFFRPSFAERLAKDIPDARLVWVDDSATFVAVDAPEELAGLISDFVRNARKGADRLAG
ncbi:MAG TPA: alpha/beta hydrolase [Pseudonocardia sp.]|nr:alpha/beta hydrolase [Pseudonocardia sp.]